MGRDARCAWTWGGTRDEGVAHLDAASLILRGAQRRVVPFDAMQGVRAEDDDLRFRYDGVAVTLNLGTRDAVRWRDAILHPPPLAGKLGIGEGTRVRLDGDPDAALRTALEGASLVGPRAQADIVVAVCRDDAALEAALARHDRPLSRGTPIWIVYPKGKTSTLPEGRVRDAMRSRGLVDTKVAAVSAELTAARFQQRKADEAAP